MLFIGGMILHSLYDAPLMTILSEIIPKQYLNYALLAIATRKFQKAYLLQILGKTNHLSALSGTPVSIKHKAEPQRCLEP